VIGETHVQLGFLREPQGWKSKLVIYLSLVVFFALQVIVHNSAKSIRVKGTDYFFFPKPSQYMYYGFKNFLGDSDVFTSKMLRIWLMFSPLGERLALSNYDVVLGWLDICSENAPKERVYKDVVIYWSMTPEKTRVKKVIKFLENSLQKFKDDWQLPFKIAFLYQHRLKNLEKAEIYYSMASKIAVEHGGPDWVKDHPVYVFLKQGEVESAIQFYKTILPEIKSSVMRQALKEKVEKYIEEINPLSNFLENMKKDVRER